MYSAAYMYVCMYVWQLFVFWAAEPPAHRRRGRRTALNTLPNLWPGVRGIVV